MTHADELRLDWLLDRLEHSDTMLCATMKSENRNIAKQLKWESLLVDLVGVGKTVITSSNIPLTV